MARPRSEQARRKVLDAAAELALEVGIRAFAIDEVARRSGVAKTTIYRHFGSKNALIVAAIDEAMPVPRAPDEGDLVGDLTEFYKEILPIFGNQGLRALLLETMAVGVHDPELHELASTMMTGRFQSLGRIIRRAQTREEIPDSIDLATALEVVEGPLFVRSQGPPTRLATTDPAELAATVVARLRV